MSASASLICVHPKDVPAIWPLVADRLRAAYLRTDLSHTADLERDVLQGGAVLWVAACPGVPVAEIEAALVAKLVRTDRNLVCIITACGGSNMSRWFDHLAAIERWAKAEGAAKIRLFGRKGWLRLLKQYQAKNVVLERAL
ncbi:hypothetical protein J6524_04785 [Bradyrhizobium sp. WSM 1738]|uniref:hypothetical protein n=1 Tax=Bradyrhizobium hereditatis TaxID=2821405 RepID=UPI001CE2C777|nr:hypothetical protein [Bradyrhizobium hereditatis]MCA6114245.1 hypothetical protein [Bradyrhizobium hereditatis]